MPDIPITVRGDVDDRAVQQLRRCAQAGDAVAGVLCADGHVGYSQPIGGAVAYPEHISPSGVGYDIGCFAAGTPVTTDDGAWRPIEDIAAGDPVVCWDTHRLRRAVPVAGTVARGARPTLRVRLADGRGLVLTPDHRVRTKLGWTPAEALRTGSAVAVAPFVGLPYEIATHEIPLGAGRITRHRDTNQELRGRGLLPLRADDPRLPALLRLLGFLLGDGHLHPNRKDCCWYTSAGEDAQALAGDLRELGWTAAVLERARGRGVRRQFIVKTSSVALHDLLARLGCPIGATTGAWPADPMPWVADLPAHLRALLLSAFASAKATTPALRSGSGDLAPPAMTQAGVNTNAVHWLGRLVASLGFDHAITPSGGPRPAGGRSWVLQVQGGESAQVRWLREIGFCRAVEKRRAAAAMLSAAAQRPAMLDVEGTAIAHAFAARATGDGTVRDLVRGTGGRFGARAALVHHGLDGRGEPRCPDGWRLDPDHSNEVAWLPVIDIAEGPVVPVYDVVTGDEAACFLAAGAVVHNCGNKAVRTDLLVEDVRPALPRLMDAVVERISFGVGRRNDEPVDHPVLDRIREAPFAPQRKLRSLAAGQLGTVGAGNHYVDLFAGDDGHVWIGVHFGSRGFGHKTASGFLSLAAGGRFDERGRDGEMDSPPVLLHVDSELGQAYIEAMQLAGEYAYAGRDVVVDKVLEILGGVATYEVHNHHNFAWRETHHGEDVWVIRKGCTPAFPGQEGFVGATMGEPSVILRGTDTPGGQALLHSTVHGAGRVMSRTQAAGRMGQRAECTVRDCAFWVTWAQFQDERRKARAKEDRFTLCPRHPDGRMAKRRGRVKAGLVDFAAVRARLDAQGIELRGGAADEAPDAYKRLDEVLAAHADTIEVVHRLQPLGVAMAAAGTLDPYKD